MNPEDFLNTALDLLQQNKREADLRTCVSRGYYALYHMLSQKLLADIPLTLLQASGLGGKAQIGHERLASVLKGASHIKLKMMGGFLDNLRIARLKADYNLSRPLSHATATIEHENARILRDQLQQFGLSNLSRIVKQDLESIFGSTH